MTGSRLRAPPGRLGPALGRVAAPLALVLLPLFSARPAVAATASPSTRWPDEVVDLVATMPIQEGGRVMPLSTYAEYTLLSWGRRKSAKTAAEGGTTLSPVEVLLDVMLRQDAADRYPLFLVETYEVLDAVGLARVEGRQKRDRYSFEELRGAYARIEQSAAAIRARQKATGRGPTAVEGGIVALADALETYVRLREFLEFAAPYPRPDELPGLSNLFPGEKAVRFHDVLSHVRDLRDAAGGGSDERSRLAAVLLDDAAKRLRERGPDGKEYPRSGWTLASVPPASPAADEPAWLRPAEISSLVLAGAPVDPAYLAVLAAYERCVESADDPASSAPAFRDLHDRVEALARARGEYDKIVLEVSLSRLDPFGRSLFGYLAAFLLVAATWLWRRRPLVVLAWVAILGTLALHATGIVLRCVVRERPPMLNLFDTTLFISAAAVGACAVLEWISRRGVAFALAPFCGALGLLVSQSYERGLGEDTMRPPVAVLDTNFWLSTHVVFVAIGYTASLVAALFANLHVAGRVLGLKRGDPAFHHAVARMAYGTLCFGLFFSLVGTIAGGIWANESWGRFWGWDPKENGALMICLVQIATLHARMGGILKSLGLSVAMSFCGCVVAFSWWGVNNMGIGLHSYGFTSGVWNTLYAAWGVEAFVMGAGVWRAWKDGRERVAATA